jgi:protocatechuate 3,4-dioxygenase beta subunit
MKHATLAFAGCLVGLVSASSLAAGELRGRILAEDKAAPGVTVAAVPFESPFAEARREARGEKSPGPIASATTRPDGTFNLSLAPPAGANPAPTLVRLTVSGSGLAPILLYSVFDTTENAEVGDVAVAKAAALAGKVVDGRGGPIVGATVTLWSGSGRVVGRDGSPVPVTTTTGADGTFRLSDAAERGNRLRVEAPGFAFAEIGGVASGAVRRPITLSLGRALPGTALRDDRRTPAGGSLVRFEGRGVSRWFEVRPDGSFLLYGVPAEVGTLVVDAGERGQGSAPLEATAAKASVVVAPPATLKGRVVEASSGAPVPRLRVVARSGGALFVGRSGPDGHYEMRGLSGRTYRLVVDDAAFLPWSREGVRVAPGETKSEDVALGRAAALSGRVVDANGVPIEGATGRLARGGENRFRAFRSGALGSAAFRTAPDGSFKATRLPPGNGQVLTVQHPDYETRTIGGVSLAIGATSRLNVVLQSGLSLRGVVKDERDHPIVGAEVQVIRDFRFQSRGGQAQFSFVGPGATVRRETTLDGRFEFRGVTTGEYRMMVTKRGWAREQIPSVKVTDGKAPEPLEIVLRPGATISGHVREKSGSGAGGYRVYARPAGAAGGAQMGLFGGAGGEEVTGDDGSFVIESVTAGEAYDVQAFSNAGIGPRKAGVAVPADGVELTVSGRGRMRGVVLDADSGRPIRDFEVAYTQSRGGSFVVRVGTVGSRGPNQAVAFHAEDGVFTLDEVGAGKWEVEVRAEGYQGGRAGGVAVEEGATTEGVEVRLSRGGMISGRVMDARSGRPVRDAAIRAALAGDHTQMVFGPGDDERQASSDADGHFEIPGLAAGSYSVTATHPEWSEATEKVELKEGAVAVDIRMNAGATIGGVVVGAGQRPVGGASISLDATGGDPFGEQFTVADDAGRFRFERLTPGRYTVTALLRSQSSSPAEVVLASTDAAREVTLSLGVGALIRGVVSGLAEAQRIGVNVNAGGSEDFFATTRTEAGGTFEFSGVPAGPVNLTASAGDFLNGSRRAGTQVIVPEGQLEVSAEIVFAPGFRLDGHVSRGGKAVVDAVVNAFPEAGSGSGGSARTDEAGGFVVEGLVAGTYNVSVMPLSGGAAIRKTVTVSGDTSVELDAPAARLAGTVVEHGSGRPLGDAQVQTVDRGSGYVAMSMATSDSNGRFALEDLEPRPYQVSVQKAAYQAETRELTAAEQSDVVIELRRGEGVGVVAKDGIYLTPLRTLEVRVLDAQGLAVFTGGITLDSEGQGEIPALQPGIYQLRASSSGYAPLSLPSITVPASSVSLTFTPGGTVEVHAGPETLGKPEAKGRILYQNESVYLPFIYSTDAEIRFNYPVRRLENVAPGTYVFAVDGGARQPFEVREGGTAVVTLP